MRRRTALIAFAVVILGVAGFYVVRYVTYGRFFESTDDAYVKADTTAIAPRVNGYVAKVLVTDNQAVRGGDVLISIDDADFKAATERAQADVASKQAIVDSMAAKTELEHRLIEAAQAKVESALADQKRAAADLQRAANLQTTGNGSKQTYDMALADSRKADAGVENANAALAAEKQQLTLLDTTKTQSAADLDGAKAALKLAEIDLEHTLVRAPYDGVVGARNVTDGQYVRTGVQLMSLVKLSDVYVVANFKETQAGEMRRGQAVSITVDALPGETLHGKVDSFSPSTGSEFSLLPPENATGNFTKIVQRLPVKIILDHSDDLAFLRPGMSVLASVDLRSEGEGTLARLAPAPRPVDTAGGGR